MILLKVDENVVVLDDGFVLVIQFPKYWRKLDRRPNKHSNSWNPSTFAQYLEVYLFKIAPIFTKLRGLLIHVMNVIKYFSNPKKFNLFLVVHDYVIHCHVELCRIAHSWNLNLYP